MSLAISVLFLFFLFPSPSLSSLSELPALMALKASLDPKNQFLASWTPHSDPCSGAFEGVACSELGRVANISLQGKGLSGQIPGAVADLKSLTGLYLHFNSLNGNIPKELTSLSQLTDLYLNVNNLSGEIPPGFGNMPNLQVLQLCYNRLSGSIPIQLRYLKRLSVLALQYNELTGAIPASLGELKTLTRLDLSFNSLFGSVPAKLADAPMLEVLDIRNNSLSGTLPQELKRLDGGFQYKNNPHLCGVGFPGLHGCTASDGWDPNMPEPYQPSNLSGNSFPNSTRNSSTKVLPESANLDSNCSRSNCSKASKSPQIGVVLGVVGLFVAFIASGLFSFSWYRHRKQKIGSAFDASDSRLSTDQAKEVYRKSASPLISLEYSNGWDPFAKGSSGFSQEVLESFMFNLEEVERATQCFSELNLLGKSSFSAIYKGVLRDGSVVVVKCIAKTSCKSDEAEFLKGLKMLTSLKHENLVKLRGFCCSRGRGECFLIYDFVPNGSLLRYLDIKEGTGTALQWTTRVSIINGIAKGIAYLHGNKGKKSAMVHQNISAEKVLIDTNYKPMISNSGLHKLLADDIIFSMLKASAAMGYLAPEYTGTGRITAESDVYAFGMILFQTLTGKQKITQLDRQGAESCRFEDFIDQNLVGKFSESEAAKLAEMALLCTHESPNHRPTMENVVQELSRLISH
ncbi:Tyrosine-protein kinase [Parasponia andersonii]|uniref:Tyrosine-protein kinase n=1 Tax=Parasponia andersonii TaxID=3476 RepID=A0A2P5BHX7_PARAD|nr:Tyrosine-protein kinase [Parasponia andersonii]